MDLATAWLDCKYGPCLPINGVGQAQ